MHVLSSETAITVTTELVTKVSTSFQLKISKVNGKGLSYMVLNTDKLEWRNKIHVADPNIVGTKLW